MQPSSIKFKIDKTGISPSPFFVQWIATACDKMFYELLEAGKVRLWARVGSAASPLQRLSYTVWPDDVFGDTARGRMNWRDGGFLLQGTSECVFDCHIEDADFTAANPPSSRAVVDPPAHWMPIRYILTSHPEMIACVRKSLSYFSRGGNSYFEFDLTSPTSMKARTLIGSPKLTYLFQGAAIEQRDYKGKLLETYFLWNSSAPNEDSVGRALEIGMAHEPEWIDEHPGLTEGEIAIVEIAKRLWKNGRAPAGMLATTRNQMIQTELKKAVLGRNYDERTIRGALSKAGFVRERRRIS